MTISHQNVHALSIYQSKQMPFLSLNRNLGQENTSCELHVPIELNLKVCK